MSRTLEFNTIAKTSHFAEGSFEVAVPTALPNSPEPCEMLKIDGATEDISPQVVGALHKALYRLRQLIESRAPVQYDCWTFGTLLCDGQVTPETHGPESYPYTVTGYYRSVTPLDEAGEAPRVLEPTMLGNIVTEGLDLLEADHMVTRLDPDFDLYAQKFGDGHIGIADLATSAGFYGSSLVAPALNYRVSSASTDDLIYYEAPDASVAPTSPVISYTVVQPPPF